MSVNMITVAIHTLRHACALKNLLEREGVKATLQNVNLSNPEVTAGVRVRINEEDLPVALRIIENPEVFGIEKAEENDTPVILVPTDFSPHSSKACELAFSLAKTHEASIHLLHSFLDPVYSKRSQLNDNLNFDNDQAHDVATDNAMCAAKASMSELENKIVSGIKNGEIPPVKFTHQISEGVPEDVINQYAREHRPMLIVMGTRMADDKARELVGSVAAEVLDTCRLPVLTIPGGEGVKNTGCNFKHIVFFSNFDQQGILAIDNMLKLLPAKPMEICLVKLPSKKFTGDVAASLSRLKDYCLSHYPVHKFSIDEMNISSVDEDFRRLINQYSVEIIVVPNKKKNAFARFFNPGLAHRLLFQSDIPMLVVPI